MEIKGSMGTGGGKEAKGLDQKGEIRKQATLH